MFLPLLCCCCSLLPVKILGFYFIFFFKFKFFFFCFFILFAVNSIMILIASQLIQSQPQYEFTSCSLMPHVCNTCLIQLKVKLMCGNFLAPLFCFCCCCCCCWIHRPRIIYVCMYVCSCPDLFEI